MTSKELTRRILLRLYKLKYLIIIFGVIIAVAAYLYARTIPPVYSVKSTLYPLTSGPDKSSATSKLSELIGGGSGTKSLTEEANIDFTLFIRAQE